MPIIFRTFSTQCSWWAWGKWLKVTFTANVNIWNLLRPALNIHVIYIFHSKILFINCTSSYNDIISLEETGCLQFQNPLSLSLTWAGHSPIGGQNLPNAAGTVLFWFLLKKLGMALRKLELSWQSHFVQELFLFINYVLEQILIF